jgi:hypothetical protein
MYMVLVCNPEGKDHLEEPGAGGRLLLRWIFRRWDVGAWSGSIWLMDKNRWRVLVKEVSK